MLGGTLVTKQSGRRASPWNTLYLARKMALEREMYFAILLDRKTWPRHHAAAREAPASRTWPRSSRRRLSR